LQEPAADGDAVDPDAVVVDAGNAPPSGGVAQDKVKEDNVEFIDKTKQFEEGARILASARKLAIDKHNGTNHSAPMGVMQGWVRDGTMIIKEAAVRKAFLQMTAADLGCTWCKLANQDEKHPGKGPRASAEEKPGRWTLDLCGKKWTPARWSGDRVWAVWTAPNNKGVFVSQHCKKKGVFYALKKNRKRWELMTGEPMLCLGCDRGGENQGLVKKLCDKYGIIMDLTAPGESVGASETYINVLAERVVACLRAGGLGLAYWAECLNGCVRALDYMPCAPLDGMSMYEHRTGRKPPLHRLFPFGAWTSAHIRAQERLKGENRGRETIMLGPAADDSDGYRLLTLDKASLIHSRSVTVYPVYPRLGDPLVRGGDGVVSFASDQMSEFPYPAGVSTAGLAGVKAALPDNAGVQLPANAGIHEAAPMVIPAVESVMGKRISAPPERFSDDGYRAAAHHDKETAGSVLVTSSAGERLPHVMNAGMVPTTHSEAANSEEKMNWQAAERVEIVHLLEIGTFRKVKARSAVAMAARRNGVLHSRPVYDRKPLGVDSVEVGDTYIIDDVGTKWRFKCRIVAKGYSQRDGSFGETYAGTPGAVTNRVMFSHALFKRWKMRSKDVTSAFLIPDLPEEEWVVFVFPPGFEAEFQKAFNLKDDEDLICVRPLYGMRQASARFSEMRDGVLCGPNLNFVPVRCDPALFVHKDKNGEVDAVTAPHVDDIALAGRGGLADSLMSKLAEELPMTGDGEVRWHLKVDISRSADGRSLEYSQLLYAKAILKEAGMENCNPASTPSIENVVLRKPTKPITPEEVAELKVLNFNYPRIVAMFGWLMQTSRPELCESVSASKAHVNDYRVAHVNYVKHMCKYLKGTLNFGLRWTLDPSLDQPAAGQFKMYVDSSFASDGKQGDSDEKPMSRYGGVVMYNGAAVAWWSRKETRTSRSSTDAEIVGLDEGARRALWFRQLGMDIGVNGAETIEIFEDNSQAEGFAMDTKVPKRTKYMNVRFHAVRDDVKFGDIKVSPVATADNIADAMTKPLGRVKFERFRERMGVVPCTLNARL
jgi:hypothetical protein